MPHHGVQAVIDALADRLQRSVVVDDPLVRMLYASRHFGDEDEVRVRAVLQRDAGRAAVGHVLAQGVAGWTAPGVVPALPGIGMRQRVCVPVRRRGRLVGLVLVVDADGSLTADELDDVRSTAGSLAPLLEAEQPSAGVDGDLAAALADLIGDDDGRRASAAASLERAAGTDVLTGARVVVLRGERDGRAATGELVGAALQVALRETAPAGTAPGRGDAVAARVDDGTATVLVGGGRAARAEVAGRVERLVRTATEVQAEVGGGAVTWTAGVSAPLDGPAGAAAAHQQAVLAARAAGPVAWWEDLGVLALLLQLPPGTDRRVALPEQVQRLLAVDPDGRLTATVRAYLDHGGSGPRSAAALHVHRTTLYYRLERVAELTGLDLTDGPTRLALHAGLLALDLLDPPR